MRIILLLLAATLLQAQSRLVVISIDGLDHRYLKDRDKLGLSTPNLRRITETGLWADGVVGIVPTVTWPSHTTLITGVRAEEHGILDNNITTAAGSQRYWYASYLKATTLWQAAKRAGKRVAAVNWPVMVGAEIDWNIPEYFAARSGAGMDLKSAEEKATPGLIAAISKASPSFSTEWLDDRSWTLATIYILKTHQPDLLLLHLVELDDAAHEAGPFTREANATLEHLDDLVGQIMAAAPAGTAFALVSDHGFEAGPREMNAAAFLASKKLNANGTIVRLGYLTTQDPAVAAALKAASADERTCVGREIPRSEIDLFLPGSARGARLFEPAPGCIFATGKAGGELITVKSTHTGEHGHWPTRYRASFAISGPGIKPERLNEMDMREAVKHFARVLGLTYPF